MRDPEQTPDRRPLVYGVFAVVILLVAAYLFMPQGKDEPTELVLTPESVRQNAAVDAGNSDAGLGFADDLASSIDPSLDGGIETLPADDGPAVETHIDGQRTSLSSSTSPAETTPKTTAAKSTIPKSTPTPVAPSTTPSRTPSTASERASLTQPGSSGEWVLNVGAFSTSDNATRQVEQLGRQGVSAHVRSTSKDDGSPLYRVRVGYFPTSSAAKTYGEWLKRSQNLDSWAGKR